jgi:hypothetical protein
MPDALKIDLGPVKTEDLEDSAVSFEVVAASWTGCDQAAGLADYYTGIARAFREELACRQADVIGGLRLVESDLGADDDKALRIALKRIERQWEGERGDGGMGPFFTRVATPIWVEIMRRQEMTTAEKTDSIPMMTMN